MAGRRRADKPIESFAAKVESNPASDPDAAGSGGRRRALPVRGQPARRCDRLASQADQQQISHASSLYPNSPMVRLAMPPRNLPTRINATRSTAGRYSAVPLRISATLDAAMLHVYGLTRSEAEYVIDSVTVVGKYEERAV